MQQQERAGIKVDNVLIGRKDYHDKIASNLKARDIRSACDRNHGNVDKTEDICLLKM